MTLHFSRTAAPSSPTVRSQTRGSATALRPLAALEAHVGVAIGSDSVASNNRIDMLGEAHVAQILQRAHARATGVLPSHLLMRLVTIDAARALGIAGRTGSLEVGKDADLCAVLDDPGTTPAGAPLDALFHAASGSEVVLTTSGVGCFTSEAVT